MTKKIEKELGGAVNKTFNDLRTKIEELLERYGKKENDKVIDIIELINNRKQLSEDLNRKNK